MIQGNKIIDRYVWNPRPVNWQNRRGQALVPVIFVTLILTAVAVAVTTGTLSELRSAQNFHRETSQFYAARGAVNLAAAALAQTSNNGFTYGMVPTQTDTDANGWKQIGDQWVKIDAVDTGALLDINSTAVTAAMLQQLPVFRNNPDVASAIADWKSTGEQASTDGAKSEYYQTLPNPYNSKDAPFDTVEELLLVKGMTPSLLYGTVAGTPVAPDSNLILTGNSSAGSGSGSSSGSSTSPGGLTRQASLGTAQTGAASGQAATAGSPGPFEDTFTSSQIPLADILTTVAKERNVAADGTPRVNINTATAQDLQDKLGLSAALAAGLVNYRSGNTGGGFGGGGGGRPRPGGGGGGPGQGGGGGRPRPGGGGNGGGAGGLPGGGGGPGLQGGGGGRPRPGGGGGGGRPRPGGGGNGGGPGLQGGSGGPGLQGGGGGRPRPGGGGAGGLQGGGARPNTIQSGAFLPHVIGTRQALPTGGAATGGAGGLQGGGTTPPGSTGAGGSTPGSAQTFKSIGDLLEVPNFTRTIMQSIADKISTDDLPYHADVININTAPAEVLATVPGMDATILNAILQYRQGGQAFQTLGDLFTLQSISRTQYEAVIGHLAAKSSFYRIRVRVRSEGQQSQFAAVALIQLTDNGPLILQWREVGRVPGWALWSSSPTLPAPTTSGTATTTSATQGSATQ